MCACVRLFSGVQFVRQCLKSMCKEKGNIFSNSSLFCMFFFIDYKLLCALVALSCKLYSHTLKKHYSVIDYQVYSLILYLQKESWQSDRMRWTRNPVYPLPGIGGLNPSSSANK